MPRKTKPNAESIQQEQTVDPETNVNNNINQQTEKAVQEIQDAEIADVAETQETTTAQAEEQPVALYRQPSNTFKPAVSLEEDFEEEPENASSLSKIQQAMSGGMFANLFSAKTLDWLLRIAFLAVIIAALYKMFNPKNKNVKIDLNPNSRAREVDLLKTLNDRRSSIGTGLRDYPTSLPKKPGYSSISNYGLKEYQTSQMPPKNLGIKNSMSSIKRETKYIKPPTNPSLMNRNEKIDPLSRSSTKTLNPALNQSKITQKEIDNAKVNIDSQRFLETMAKIYEKSGRVDLAKGIEKKILHK
ncbi:MAG: hypothetical protein MZV64_26855 [Ignavibacteriales bacterium]|nr:hypothetical protein [Ignavibacteriales bacterium]